MITGSGPQNRDSEILGNKPFLVIADYLTRNGIAVLRYDDRGCFESEGDFSAATTLDLATDVEAAVTYLRSRNDLGITQIGLIGHSEGGIIAPIVASNKENKLDFIVLLAGTGVNGKELLLMQQYAIGKASGLSDETLKTAQSINKKFYQIIYDTEETKQIKNLIKKESKNLLKEYPAIKPKEISKKKYIEQQMKQLCNPWIIQFIKLDPKDYLTKVNCPVIALNGTKDLQVPFEINLKNIEESVKKANQDIYIQKLEGLNHLFQHCDKGIPAEYSTSKETIAPIALDRILQGIQYVLNK